MKKRSSGNLATLARSTARPGLGPFAFLCDIIQNDDDIIKPTNGVQHFLHNPDDVVDKVRSDTYGEVGRVAGGGNP